MEFYQLTSFATVAKTANITRAAHILHTTPPSVSNHIRQIEEELDILLFTRTSRGMVITSQGKQLLDKARDILQSVQKFKDLATDLKSKINGHLSLAINSAPEFLRVPDIIEKTLKKYPGIKLEIVPSSTGLILDAIEQGTLDCGFAFGPLKENRIHSISLSSVDLVIAIPFKFEAQYRNASLEALIELPWVVPENRCPFLQQIKDHLNLLGCKLENRIFANDDITKLTLVEKGAAVCVLEQSEAAPFIKNKTIVPWEGPDHFESLLSFVYSADRSDDLLIITMESIIREFWKSERVI